MNRFLLEGLRAQQEDKMRPKLNTSVNSQRYNMSWTEKELRVFLESGLIRQGWTISESSTGWTLTHNDHFIQGELTLVEWLEESDVKVEGFNFYMVLGEEDFEYAVYDEYFENLPSLKSRLQRILDDWRDVHRPIYNLLWKALELRKLAFDTDDTKWYKQYKSVADDANKVLNRFKQLEYNERS